MSTLIKVSIEQPTYYTLTYDMAEIANGLGIPLANIEEVSMCGPGICVEYKDEEGNLLEDYFYSDSAVEESEPDYGDSDSYDLDDEAFQETLKRAKDPLYKMVVEYKRKESV